MQTDNQIGATGQGNAGASAPEAEAGAFIDPSWAARAALAACVILYAWWFTDQSLQRWAAMHASLDFVHLDSAAYNTACGKFMFSNAKMINFWAEHISPVLLAVSLFYLFSDEYWFIFFYQSASIALAAVPLFLLARRYLKREPAAFLIAAGYLANGMIHRANLFEYHEYAHTGLFFFSALYCALVRRWGWYAIFCAGILAVKEDGFVTLAGAGMFAAVAAGAWRQAALTWLAGAAVALVEFQVIYPWLREGAAYKYDSYYAWLGDGAWEKLSYIFGDPRKFMADALSTPARAGAWWNLILGFMFLPLFSPLGAAMLLGPSMELFLSWYPGAHGLSFHYPLLALPMWTIASVMGLANILRLLAFFRVSQRALALATLIPPLYILSMNLWLGQYYGGLPFLADPSRQIAEKDREHARIVRDALLVIPPRAAVSAHDGPFSFLTHNPNAYLYHGEKTGHAIVEFYKGNRTHGYLMWPFTAMDVEYILLDVNAPGQFRKAHAWDVEDVKSLPEYELILERDGFYIFRLRKGFSSKNIKAADRAP